MKLLLFVVILLFAIFIAQLLYKKDRLKVPYSLTNPKPVTIKKNLVRFISPYTGDQILTELYPWANNNALNQDQCGSCWAFATAKVIAFAYRRYYGTTTTTEGTHAKYLYQAVDYNNSIYKDNLTTSSTIKNTISPFYLAACTKVNEHLDPTVACQGASLEEALEYAKNNPLTSVLFNTAKFQYQCPTSFPTNSPKYMIDSYSHLGYEDGYLNLDQAVLDAEKVLHGDYFVNYLDEQGNKMEGYILAGIAVNDYFLNNYNKNIILSSNEDTINHAVVIVGYGVLKSVGADVGIPYWLVHNSWGNVHNPPLPYKSTNYGSYFMVEKGKNCLGIESNMYAVKIKPF